MLKFFFTLFLIFSSALVLINGQSNSTYPVEPELAKPCLDILNKTGVVSDCLSQAMSRWPLMKNGKEDDKWLERDECCLQYDQVDCKISAIKSGICTVNSTKAALLHQTHLVNYFAKEQCLTVPYHSEMCKFF